MNTNRNSDESVVPATSANNEATDASTESIEERDSTKRNAEQADMLRTQGRDQSMSFGLHGVREAARKDSQLRFTNMFSGDGLHFVWHRIVFTEESCTGMAVPVQQRLVDRWFLGRTDRVSA